MLVKFKGALHILREIQHVYIDCSMKWLVNGVVKSQSEKQTTISTKFTPMVFADDSKPMLHKKKHIRFQI